MNRRAEAGRVLERLGVSPEAVAAGTLAAEQLAALATGPHGADAIAALGEIAAGGLAPTLVALEPRLEDRALRKILRRALHRIRERGIAVPAPVAAAPVAAGRPAEIDGFVTAVDGRGDRLVWLARSLPAGGTLLVAVQINEPGGLHDVRVAEVSRRQMRDARQSLERDTGLRLVPADWRVLDALCVEAHGRTAEHGRHSDYLKVRPRLTALPPVPDTELVSPALTAPEGDTAAALVRRSAALLEEREFGSWWPDPEAAAPFIEEIAAVRDSPIVLAELQQQERLGSVLARAAAALWPAAVLARRLRATAYVLAATGRREPAAQALAVAGALEHGPVGAGDVPFVAALAQRALGHLLAERTSRETGERRDALVLTPAELRARGPGHPPHTPR